MTLLQICSTAETKTGPEPVTTFGLLVYDTIQFGRWVQDLGGTCSTLKARISLKMETTGSFEMPIPIYRLRGNTSQKTVIFTEQI